MKELYCKLGRFSGELSAEGGCRRARIMEGCLLVLNALEEDPFIVKWTPLCRESFSAIVKHGDNLFGIVFESVQSLKYTFKVSCNGIFAVVHWDVSKSKNNISFLIDGCMEKNEIESFKAYTTDIQLLDSAFYIPKVYNKLVNHFNRR